METIYILMKVLFSVLVMAGLACGTGLVLWEVAKRITKNMGDDERYDG